MAKSTDYIELLMPGLNEPMQLPLEGLTAKERAAIVARDVAEKARRAAEDAGAEALAKTKTLAAVGDTKRAQDKVVKGASQDATEKAAGQVIKTYTPDGSEVQIRRQPGESVADWTAKAHRIANYPSANPKPLPEDRNPVPEMKTSNFPRLPEDRNPVPSGDTSRPASGSEAPSAIEEQVGSAGGVGGMSPLAMLRATVLGAAPAGAGGGSGGGTGSGAMGGPGGGPGDQSPVPTIDPVLSGAGSPVPGLEGNGPGGSLLPDLSGIPGLKTAGEVLAAPFGGVISPGTFDLARTIAGGGDSAFSGDHPQTPGDLPAAAQTTQTQPQGQPDLGYYPPMPALPGAPTPVDWAAANKAAQDIAKEQQGILQANADVEKKGLETQADLRQKALDEAALLDAAQARAQGAYEAEKDRHLKALEELNAVRLAESKQSVDPHRWWNSKTSGEKAASYIAAALFGFTGHGMDYLSLVSTEIDRDLRLQQQAFERRDKGLAAAIEAEDSLYGKARQLGLDSQAAYHAARSQRFEDMARQVEMQKDRTESQTVRNNADLAASKLRMQAIDSGSKYLHYGEEAALQNRSISMQGAIAMMHEARADRRAQAKSSIEDRASAQVNRALGGVRGALESLRGIRKNMDQNRGADIRASLRSIPGIATLTGQAGIEADLQNSVIGAASAVGEGKYAAQHKHMQDTLGTGSRGEASRQFVDRLIKHLEAREQGYLKYSTSNLTAQERARIEASAAADSGGAGSGGAAPAIPETE